MHERLNRHNQNQRTLTFFIASFFIFLPSLLISQTIPLKFNRLSIQQGLSQGSINCINQDSEGFIWFGTQDGLNRYDGYTFKIFRHDPQDTNSIPNEWIHSLYKDSKGDLWIGTDGGGLCRRKPGEMGFKTVVITTPQNRQSRYPVKAILEDNSGKLWIGTDGDGLISYDSEKGFFEQFERQLTNTNSLSSNSVYCLAQDSAGFLWIGTGGGGLDRYDLKTGTFTHYRRENGLKDEFIRSLLIGSSGQLYVGTDSGLHMFDKALDRFIHFPLRDRHSKQDDYSVRSILQDGSGKIWTGSYGNGLGRADTQTRTVVANYSRWDEDNMPANDFINSLYEDISGLLWIGTDGDGVSQLIRNAQKLIHFRHDNHQPSGLSEKFVFSFCEDPKGNLWVGTYGGGLNKLDTVESAFVHYKETGNSEPSPGSNNIFSLLTDSKGTIWIGTADAGLDKFDPVLHQFTHYSKQSGHGLRSNVIRALALDSAGAIWCGTDAGLYRFDTATEKFTEYSFKPGLTGGISDNMIWCLYVDRAGILWVGTRNGGLNRFDPSTETFTTYKNDPRITNTLPPNGIWSLCEDRSGRLWVGTAGGGLTLFGRKSNTFTRFTEKEGLPNQVIYGILEDDSGCLWLSTNKGISKFDPQKKSFTNYDMKDGLQSNEFNSGAFYKNKKGELMFGGVNGFTMFNPADIKANPNIPPVVLTSFKKLDEAIPLAPTGVSQIELTYKENVISFEFSALDFTRSEKNQYAYMMEGFDGGWINAGHKHDVTYTNLDHGSYTFKVKASNSDGVWNEKGFSVLIHISPPFWKTWWFRFIGLSGFVFILYRAYKYRTRKIKRKNKELEMMVADRTHNLEKANTELKIANEKILQANEVRSRFLANMSHELRTPLNSIIGFSDLLIQGVLGKVPNEQEEAIHAISSSSKNLLKLINDVLDLSKIEAGKMNLKCKPVHLDEIIHDARNIMLPLFEQKKHLFEMKIPAESMIITVDDNKIRQVLINLLSNAAKFTPPGGKIILEAQPIFFNNHAAGYLEIRVADNGKGIRPEELETVFEEFRQSSDNADNQGTGLGLALSKRIVELHGGRIWAESDGKSGTEFIVHLPINGNSSI